MAVLNPSVFDLIHDSPLHHPLLCWAATPLVLAALWRARPRSDAGSEARALWQLALFGQLLIALDALATGSFSPLAADSAASSVVALGFVLLGDLRYFVLLARFARVPAPPLPQVVIRALALTLLSTVLVLLANMFFPLVFQEPRRKFLAYEVLFLLVLALVRGVVLPRWLALPAPGSDAAQRRSWLHRLTAFEASQYALWALADVVILSGARSGLLLRLIPNVLYYVAFVPFAFFTAPPSLRSRRRTA